MSMTKRGDWGDLQKSLWILLYRMYYCMDLLGGEEQKETLPWLLGQHPTGRHVGKLTAASSAACG